MNNQKRRKFTPEFKAKVALEALKEQSTLSEIAKKFEVSPVVISRWKSEFASDMSAVFKKSNPNSLKKMLTLENCMLKSGS